MVSSPSQLSRRTGAVCATAALALTLLAALALDAPATGAKPEALETAAGQRVSAERLQAAAELVRGDVEDIRRLLTSDPTTRVLANGRIAYADFEHSSATARAAEREAERAAERQAAATRAGTSASTPPAAGRIAARTPVALSSRPSSPRTLYLDFNGERVCDTEWNDAGLACGTFAGYDTDGSPSFSAGEQRAVRQVWERVAEDYAPFNINVTTVVPRASDLSRTSTSDQRYGVHAVVTSSDEARNATCGGPGCAGVALLGVFPRTDANHARVLWAFTNEVDDSPRLLADVLSHEAGHTLGLEHQGTAGGLLGIGAEEYYAGHGIWAPIMGSSLRHLTQWSASEYANPSRVQDDVAVIAQHGAPAIRDDHPAGPRGADRVRRARTTGGVIGTRTDRDVFKLVTTCRAPVRATLKPAASGPNLDAALTLRKAGRSARVTSNPPSPTSGTSSGLSASISGTRGKGTWYLSVDGVGAGAPATTGYSDYGSLGRYTLRVTGRCVKR